MKEQIHLLTLVFNFLDNLSEEQIKMLLDKKARLNLKMLQVHSNAPSLDNHVEERYTAIMNCSTKEEALEYINNAKLKIADLRAIAKQYDIYLSSQDRKAQIIDKIVESTIGAKLKYNTLLHIDL